MTIRIERVADVRKLDGRVVDVAIVQRWYNVSGANLWFTEAVELESGTYAWSILRCGRDQGEYCEGRAIIDLHVDSLPSFLGSRPTADDCVQAQVAEPFDLGLPMMLPKGLMEFGGLTWCPDSKFPTAVALPGGITLNLAEEISGSGLVLRLVGMPSGERAATPVGIAHDGHFPPNPEPPHPFPLSEARSWLEKEHRAYRAFIAKHPDYFLHSSMLIDSLSGRVSPPVVGTVASTETHVRVLAVQAPSGEGIRFEIARSVDAFGKASYEVRAEEGFLSQPGIVRELLPARMADAKTAAEAVMAVVPGRLDTVHVLTSIGDDSDKVETTRSHFLYSILLRPPEGTSTYGMSIANVGFVRSDTGAVVYINGPEAVAQRLENGWEGQ